MLKKIRQSVSIAQNDIYMKHIQKLSLKKKGILFLREILLTLLGYSGLF